MLVSGRVTQQIHEVNSGHAVEELWLRLKMAHDGSMYDNIYLHECLICMVDAGKYVIHRSYGWVHRFPKQLIYFIFGG